jgi:hypothetical protein
MDGYLTPHINTTHIDHGLVYKAQLKTSYQTTRSHDLTRYLIYALCVDQLECLHVDLINLVSFIHYDGVLKINMKARHSILLFSTYRSYAQLSHDQYLDYSLNNTFVIT